MRIRRARKGMWIGEFTVGTARYACVAPTLHELLPLMSREWRNINHRIKA